jgi:hypothetical protein
MIRGIKFACVPVRDQDRALKFYTEKTRLPRNDGPALWSAALD